MRSSGDQQEATQNQRSFNIYQHLSRLPPSQLTTGAPSSTTAAQTAGRHHLQVQHGNIGCELAATTAQQTLGINYPLSLVPGRLGQAILSTQSLFHPTNKITPTERALNAVQALIAWSLVAIAITRYAKDNTCKTEQDPLCKAENILTAVYPVLLLVSWAPSQLRSNAKQKTTQTSLSNANINTPIDEADSHGDSLEERQASPTTLNLGPNIT